MVQPIAILLSFRFLRWAAASIAVSLLALLTCVPPASAEDILFDSVPANWALRTLADLDGDGRDELIWSSPVASPPGSEDYHAMFTDEDGNPVQTTTFYHQVGGAWSLVGAADFDGDGKDDLFWRNAGAGRAGIFLMNGTVTSWRSVNTPGGVPVVLSSTWSAKAFPDLDGDGRAEVVWRPLGVDKSRAWFLQITPTAAVLTSDPLFGQPLDSAVWSLVAATDAGGDGFDDLFWWSTTSGIGWVYHMSGTTLIGNNRIDPPVAAHFPDDPPGQVWTMVGVGDFSSDSHAGVSWHSAPAGLRRLTLLENGAFERYERFASNHAGASAAIAAGDLDGDGLTDLAFSESAGTEPTLHRYLTPIRGVDFRPETYLLPSETETGGSWMVWYFRPEIRSQVIEELEAIRDQTGLTHVNLPLAPGRDLTWPIPDPSELDNVAQILNDIHSTGLKVILSIPTWCQLSEQQVASTPGIGFDHVGGHCDGEVINGWELFWDCPPCMESWPFNCPSAPAPPSPGTYLQRVLRFYDEVVPDLESQLVDPRVVEYLVLSGHPGLSFGGETNLFRPNFPLKTEVAQYFDTVIPHVRSLTDWPLGVALMPEQIGSPTGIGYGFVQEWLDVMPMSEIDFIDITIPSYVDAQQMLTLVQPEYRHKIVLSDFKAAHHDANGPLPPLPLAQVMSDALEEVWGANVRGWWLWTYKKYPGTDHVGLREYSGQHGQTNQNDLAGFDLDALEVIEEDLGYR